MQFGIKETELLGGANRLMRDGVVDERWQAFMKFQIARARKLFEDAEAGVDLLDAKARWPVWSALILYRQVTAPSQTRPFLCCASRVMLVQSLLLPASCTSLRSGGMLPSLLPFPPPSCLHTTQILDAIEANGYNNFTKRAYVPKWRKLASLPAAFAKASLPQLNPGYKAAMAAGAISSQR